MLSSYPIMLKCLCFRQAKSFKIFTCFSTKTSYVSITAESTSLYKHQPSPATMSPPISTGTPTSSPLNMHIPPPVSTALKKNPHNKPTAVLTLYVVQAILRDSSPDYRCRVGSWGAVQAALRLLSKAKPPSPSSKRVAGSGTREPRIA